VLSARNRRKWGEKNPSRATLMARAQFCRDAVEGAGGSTLPMLMGSHAARATWRVPSATANALLIIFN